MGGKGVKEGEGGERGWRGCEERKGVKEGGEGVKKGEGVKEGW